MNFELNKEQKQIIKAVKDFVKGEFKKEIVHELINNKTYPEKIFKKACELGFSGIDFPESYGGEGLGILEKLLIAEVLASANSTVNNDAAPAVLCGLADKDAGVGRSAQSSDQKALSLCQASAAR